MAGMTAAPPGQKIIVWILMDFRLYRVATAVITATSQMPVTTATGGVPAKMVANTVTAALSATA